MRGSSCLGFSGERSIWVLASGRGSNFEVIARRCAEGSIPAKLLGLIVDRPCPAEDRARRLGVPLLRLGRSWSDELLEVLSSRRSDLVVLAGFMRVLPPPLVRAFYPRVVNLHPALLPSFPGVDAIGQAYRHGVKVTGITVHLVDEGVDTGPIVLQRAIRVREEWTLEELERAIHRLEHRWYPVAIRDLLLRAWTVEGRVFKFLDRPEGGVRS